MVRRPGIPVEASGDLPQVALTPPPLRPWLIRVDSNPSRVRSTRDQGALRSTSSSIRPISGAARAQLHPAPGSGSPDPGRPPYPRPMSLGLQQGVGTTKLTRKQWPGMRSPHLSGGSEGFAHFVGRVPLQGIPTRDVARPVRRGPSAAIGRENSQWVPRPSRRWARNVRFNRDGQGKDSGDAGGIVVQPRVVVVAIQWPRPGRGSVRLGAVVGAAEVLLHRALQPGRVLRGAGRELEAGAGVRAGRAVGGWQDGVGDVGGGDAGGAGLAGGGVGVLARGVGAGLGGGRDTVPGSHDPGR